MQINLDRLARAIHADAERIGDHRYRVTRADHSHIVDLTAAPGSECSCPSNRATVPCLHVLAAYLLEGERDVLRSLRPLVAYPGAYRLIRSAA